MVGFPVENLIRSVETNGSKQKSIGGEGASVLRKKPETGAAEDLRRARKCVFLSLKAMISGVLQLGALDDWVYDCKHDDGDQF